VLKVTADTNILISALAYAQGKPLRFLQMATAGDINLTVSEDIVEEMVDVLVRKFNATPREVTEARQIVAARARTIRLSVQLGVVKDDPDDNRIVECAVSAGSDYIVTGDKDLLRMKRYYSIQILTVSDFLNIARAQGQNR
jgi:uncharacterized protein